MRRQSPASGSLVASIAIALSTGGVAIAVEPDGLGGRDREELLGYARDTWKSVAAMADGCELPVDGLRHLSRDLGALPKTTPTDIACYLWSVLAAERLKIIGSDEAERRLERTLKVMERLERAHGFFYDWLDPHTGSVLKKSPDGGEPIPPIASSVDNGWLAAGLVMVRNTYPASRAGRFLARADGFRLLLRSLRRSRSHGSSGPNPRPVSHRSQDVRRVPSDHQHRAADLQLHRDRARSNPAEHYYRVERTLKPDEQKQSQNPAGETRTYLGIPVFEGHYIYRGMRIVPSWGGSMFEALMVTLFVPEERWAPRSWGVNHPLYVRAQIEYGLEEARYGYWGFSPACNPTGVPNVRGRCPRHRSLGLHVE